ncbi:lipopolysaccharide assembly protein LapB [Gloeocapsa sp. PCC 73106]|uniref:tetratricopeptide repeat protein n=1 Tax=Gloeocapsa sp. PCC 73106 TaxID=102232 RepID=UPI0002AC779D|nr:tetratricopeptide repeat protein [Gloeocapsa sp. PCC 73106]ELR99335.1 tetratricopeptide repeat protein [Gloeocapsa sp. PCC 73106]
MTRQLKILIIAITTGLWNLGVLASPLETTIPEPLIPTIDRPLTSFERYRINKTILELDSQAQAKLAENLGDQAFELWYRELRLQRALGLLPEINALGRIGAIAWSENRPDEVKIINDRLEAIALELKDEPELILALAQAYQEIRNLEQAIAFYEKSLTYGRQKQILTNLADLYLARFDYANAAKVYEELLGIARVEADVWQQSIYLQQLAEIYNEASQPENALIVKQQLAETYKQNEQYSELGMVLLSLGADYQAIDAITEASESYQAAFEVAWSQEQYGLAAEAKLNLANLYYGAEELETALSVYRELLTVYEKSYNLYGLMNTYAQIGKIYTAQNKYQEALMTFEKGLELAESLNYEQAYFNSQIEQIRAKISEQDGKI